MTYHWGDIPKRVPHKKECVSCGKILNSVGSKNKYVCGGCLNSGVSADSVDEKETNGLFWKINPLANPHLTT